jgi:hypothetical protein
LADAVQDRAGRLQRARISREDRLAAARGSESAFDEAELHAELERAAELLLRADREIALVARARPVARRQSRLDLSVVRRLLERIARTTEALGALGRLHAARARELELEARIAEALDEPAVRELAAERFAVPRGVEARRCDAFVAAALSACFEAAPKLHRSDDASDPKSLFSLISRRARELGIALRVEVRADQLATAATGEGIVALRPGIMLSRAASERITAHELVAHALPRARAAYAPLCLFRAGTARSSDHEEGRALLVERRADLFDAERRRELALRHRAALAVRSYAEPRDTLALLKELGAPEALALEIARRAHRGGGLAREIVYLPAYFAVTEAFAENPGLERWFEQGRVDLDAARLFADGVSAREARA